MAWNELKQNTITDEDGMFIKMLGFIMFLSLNVITKYWDVIQASLKM